MLPAPSARFHLLGSQGFSHAFRVTVAPLSMNTAPFPGSCAGLLSV